MGFAPAPERRPFSEEEDAMSKQVIGRREQQLRAAREAKAMSSKRVADALAAAKKPVKMKKDAKR